MIEDAVLRDISAPRRGRYRGQGDVVRAALSWWRANPDHPHLLDTDQWPERTHLNLRADSELHRWWLQLPAGKGDTAIAAIRAYLASIEDLPSDDP